ncbi:MAG: DUF6688 domain-containing protein [Sarcina sp.]
MGVTLFVVGVVVFIAGIIAMWAPIFWLYTFIISNRKSVEENKGEITAAEIEKKMEVENKVYGNKIAFTILTILGSLTLFIFNDYSANGGIQQTFYVDKFEFFTAYKIISGNGILIYVAIFIISLICTGILVSKGEKLAPIPYVLANGMLMVNVIFVIAIVIQLVGSNSDNAVVFIFPVYQLVGLMFMQFTVMSNTMKKKRIEIEKENKEYSNKLFNKIYIIFIKMHTKPLFIFILVFPIMLIIQFVLVLFGQTPDSFIRMFLDTSNYTYSMVPAPEPILIVHDSHYLCTVSARGHKKLVKPLRSGIRRNKRILVNRQLLVANAFENILEEYTPKTHKLIRYIYDKYGYPLSKNINTKFSADITYIIMKPLEWIFLVVLYSVDKNPENRINIQYSELREGVKLKYK